MKKRRKKSTPTIGHASPLLTSQCHGRSLVSTQAPWKKKISKSPQLMQAKQKIMEVYSPRRGLGPITGHSNVSADSQTKVWDLHDISFVLFGGEASSNPADSIGEGCGDYLWP